MKDLKEACLAVKVGACMHVCVYVCVIMLPLPYICVQADPSLAKKGSAGVYGMVGIIPDKAIVKDFLVEFFSEVYS